MTVNQLSIYPELRFCWLKFEPDQHLPFILHAPDHVQNMPQPLNGVQRHLGNSGQVNSFTVYRPMPYKPELSPPGSSAACHFNQRACWYGNEIPGL